MKTFDVQSIHLNTKKEQAFNYLADPAHLPQWTHAFASADDRQAVLRTASGEVSIGLAVHAAAEQGTIDWLMTFPDGSVGVASSRVVPLTADSCAYVFVLTPPPVPLELLEGALAAQSQILAQELQTLKTLLEQAA